MFGRKFDMSTSLDGDRRSQSHIGSPGDRGHPSRIINRRAWLFQEDSMRDAVLKTDLATIFNVWICNS